MKELIIKVKYGGLGDHLLYSPIPRLAKTKYDYDKVFVSTYSEYRSPETKRLVWEYNPHIDGFIDKDALSAEVISVSEDKNVLDGIANFYFPDDGVRFREPEIYYTPSMISKLAEAAIYDPNYITQVPQPSSELVKKYFKDHSVALTHQMKRLFLNSTIDDKLEELECHSLEYFCDVIFSCKQFFCLITGSATLAAALGKSATAFFVNFPGLKKMFQHSKLHNYVEL